MTGARHLIGRLAATLRPPVSAAAAGGCVSYGAASSLDRSWLLDPSSAQQRPGGGGQPQLLWGAGEHRRQGGKRPLLPAVRALQLVQVVAEMGLARELGEPHEDVLACAYRQGGEGVLGVLGLETRQRRGSRVDQHGAHLAVKEVQERLIERAVAVVEGREDTRRRRCGVADWGPPGGGGREAGSRPHRPQQQHVVTIDHRGVGLVLVRLPDRPAVEAAQCLGATRHVVEPSQPDEPVGVVQVAELPQIAMPTASWVSTNSRSKRSINTSRWPGCSVYCLSSTTGYRTSVMTRPIC